MIRISSLGSIRAVVCGYHHTLVVTREGKLFGWGKNTDKQILPLNRESVASPTEILGVGTVRTVAAGWGHSLAVTEEG
jgi:alpha-tubulin suppressor-like RCC1 family protein